MNRLSELIATHGTVKQLRTVPKRRLPRPLHHITRLGLVSAALVRLSRNRQGAAAVLSVDAGYGMVYTAALVYAAQKFGLQTSLQHHSFSYVSRRKWMMSLLVKMGGADVLHTFLCDCTRKEFVRLYPAATRTTVLSVAYAVDLPTEERRRRRSLGTSITLGHMSNLTTEKGLGEVVRVGELAQRSGLSERLILAGPVMGAAERRLLDRVVKGPSIQYRGYVTGLDKDRFFDDIDVFLFPSRYRNELSPLVVREARSRGVPVIAYRAGCLTQEDVGAGCLIVDPTQSFVDACLSQLKQWVANPESFNTASQACLDSAVTEHDAAVRDALAAGAAMFK